MYSFLKGLPSVVLQQSWLGNIAVAILQVRKLGFSELFYVYVSRPSQVCY